MRSNRWSKFRVIVGTAAILITFASSTGFALEREGNLTLYILLDRSLSMEQEIEEVKGYVNSELIGDILIPGDTVVLVEFFRHPRLVLTEEIGSEADKRNIISRIREIRANKAYTDIGSALDYMYEEAMDGGSRTERSHTLLLSDLIQEAPTTSPYAGTTRNFSHPLLVPRKETERKGWKICIIGPGIDERAERIAREVVSVRRTAD